MSEKKNTLAQAMAWNTAGNLVYCICQWIITILAVKLDSFGAAGYLSLAMTTSSTFSTIAMFSMRNFQVSDVKNEFKDAEYLGSRVLTCTAAIVLCALYAINSTSAYQMWCIDAFMLIRLAESIVDVIHGINQKYDRYDIIGKSYFLRGIATDAAFIAGFVFFKDILIAILLTGIANLLLVFIYDVRQTSRLEKLSFIIKDKNIAVLLKKCTPIVATSFLLSMFPLLPRTAIQNLLGNDILGIYSSIASPTLVVQVFATYAFNPLIPKISVLFNEKRYDAFLSVFRKILLFFAGFAVIVFIGAAVLGRWGLKLLYGETILDSYALFMPLVWCTLFTAYIWIMNSIVTSIRKIIPMMLATAAGFAICFFFTNYFVTTFGSNGASLVQIISFAVVLVLLILITEITIHQKKKELK
jgi:Membrane protein involved in the export of O-antigen and teichoic acid